MRSLTLEEQRIMHAALRRSIRIVRKAKMSKHTLYITGDRDAPDSIKGQNGEVVLDLCRVCNRGEIELSEPCSEDIADRLMVPFLREETLRRWDKIRHQLLANRDEGDGPRMGFESILDDADELRKEARKEILRLREAMDATKGQYQSEFDRWNGDRKDIFAAANLANDAAKQACSMIDMLAETLRMLLLNAQEEINHGNPYIDARYVVVTATQALEKIR